MNTIDFTSTPIIGSLMQATGIADGWMIIAIALAILMIIFLAAWICTARKSRTRAKQIAHMQEEILGLQAISNLPPLHSSAFGNPGDSIVFASTRELKKRRSALAQVAADDNTDSELSEQATAEFATPLAPVASAVDDAPKDPFAPRSFEPDKASESVTAQVHDAIFASVSSMHKDIKAKRPGSDEPEPEPQGNRVLKSSDVPAISQPTEKRKASDNADALARLEAKLSKRNAKPETADRSDKAGLSGRIPKL